jgi:hypothetical protein
MPEPVSNKTRRNREVRDVFAKLRKKYTSAVAMEFIETHYHLGQDQVYKIISEVDNVDVSKPSMIYQTVMRDDFYI